MSGTIGVGDGRVWVESMRDGRVSLQVNEADRGAMRIAEAVLSGDEAVDLAAQLLASVRSTSRFDPETGGARVAVTS